MKPRAMLVFPLLPFSVGGALSHAPIPAVGVP